MPDEEHSRHVEQEVDFTGDVGKLGTSVVVLLQVEGEEEIGLEVCEVITGIKKKRALRPGVADLVVGELEQKYAPFARDTTCKRDRIIQ